MDTVKLVSVIVVGLLVAGLVKFALTFAAVAIPLSLAVGGLAAFTLFTNFDKVKGVFVKAKSDAVDGFKK